MSLNNVQYDAIMRAYTARRARQSKELEKRLEHIHRRIPALLPPTDFPRRTVSSPTTARTARIQAMWAAKSAAV